MLAKKLQHSRFSETGVLVFMTIFYHLSKDFRDPLSETDIEIFSMTRFVSKYILVTPFRSQKIFITPKSPPTVFMTAP